MYIYIYHTGVYKDFTWGPACMLFWTMPGEQHGPQVSDRVGNLGQYLKSSWRWQSEPWMQHLKLEHKILNHINKSIDKCQFIYRYGFTCLSFHPPSFYLSPSKKISTRLQISMVSHQNSTTTINSHINIYCHKSTYFSHILIRTP
jgi:hypothetical protein